MNLTSFYTQRHAFHLVDPSAMPLLSALSALTLTTGSVLYFHGYSLGLQTTLFGFFAVLLCMFVWWRDIVREGTLEGQHTNIVQLGLRYGVILFIVSELRFFDSNCMTLKNHLFTFFKNYSDLHSLDLLNVCMLQIYFSETEKLIWNNEILEGLHLLLSRGELGLWWFQLSLRIDEPESDEFKMLDQSVAQENEAPYIRFAIWSFG